MAILSVNIQASVSLQEAAACNSRSHNVQQARCRTTREHYLWPTAKLGSTH